MEYTHVGHLGLVVSRLKFVGLPGVYMVSGSGGGDGVQVFGAKGAIINDCDFERRVLDIGINAVTFNEVSSFRSWLKCTRT